jgi:hypothetical protein
MGWSLHRQVTNNDKVQQQTALPPAHLNTVLEAMHNDMGHPGKDKTLSLLKDRFHWPGMSKDVEEWISHCGRYSVEVSWWQCSLLLYFVIIGDLSMEYVVYEMEMRKLTFQDGVFFFWLLSSLNHFSPVL